MAQTRTQEPINTQAIEYVKTLRHFYMRSADRYALMADSIQIANQCRLEGQPAWMVQFWLQTAADKVAAQ